MVRRWRLIGYFPILYSPMLGRRGEALTRWFGAKEGSALQRFERATQWLSRSATNKPCGERRERQLAAGVSRGRPWLYSTAITSMAPRWNACHTNTPTHALRMSRPITHERGDGLQPTGERVEQARPLGPHYGAPQGPRPLLALLLVPHAPPRRVLAGVAPGRAPCAAALRLWPCRPCPSTPSRWCPPPAAARWRERTRARVAGLCSRWCWRGTLCAAPTDRKASRWRRRERRRGTGGRTQRGLREKSTSERAQLGFGPEFAGHTVSGTMRAQPKCQPSQNLHLKTKRHSPRRQCPKNPQRRPPPGPCSTSPLAYWTIPGRCLVQGTRRDVPCGVRTQHPQHPVSRDISLTPRSYRDTVNHRLLWQRCDWETTAVCTQLCVGPPSPGVAGTTSLWTGSCPVRHHARPVASCSFAIRGSAVCACGRSFDVARDAMSAVEAARLDGGGGAAWWGGVR
jgi:hypothetical protein